MPFMDTLPGRVVRDLSNLGKMLIGVKTTHSDRITELEVENASLRSQLAEVNKAKRARKPRVIPNTTKDDEL